jgi:hypothetical protein
MSKLKKFDFQYDKKKGDWVLKERGNDRAVRRFDTKGKGTKGGVLGGAIGQQGGSIAIRKKNGTIQEERTFPRSADPKKSPG